MDGILGRSSGAIARDLDQRHSRRLPLLCIGHPMQMIGEPLTDSAQI